ncbi:hypothetical protein ACFL27_25175 [candidate division CSSED10-310 bacterium]|uniref:CheW-like domain-containing protein n=1 Tax=candidate division CSSED10-310 bacterium TaxID=2855610 RepID=A0ABV6Z4X4_UNCC1
MMNSENVVGTVASTDDEPVDLFAQLSVFIFTLTEHNLAIDAEQVLEITLAPKNLGLLRPDKVFIDEHDDFPLISPAFLLNTTIESLQKPRMVKFGLGGKLFGTIIEEPRRFQTLEFQEIQAMPQIINIVRGNSLLWGVFESEDELIFLLDLHRVQELADNSK